MLRHIPLSLHFGRMYSSLIELLLSVGLIHFIFFFGVKKAFSKSLC